MKQVDIDRLLKEIEKQKKINEKLQIKKAKLEGTIQKKLEEELTRRMKASD